MSILTRPRNLSTWLGSMQKPQHMQLVLLSRSTKLPIDGYSGRSINGYSCAWLAYVSCTDDRLSLSLIMVQTYFCQALDKGTLGFSSIMGIQEDAGLDSDKYNWLGTILYIGVLVGEYPTNFLAQKLPVAKYLAAK